MTPRVAIADCGSNPHFFKETPDMKTLRLLLGDQLNPEHSWFKTVREDVVYIMAEMRQETDYAPHHIQKVVAFFAAMRNFAKARTDRGAPGEILQIDRPEKSPKPARTYKAKP